MTLSFHQSVRLSERGIPVSQEDLAGLYVLYPSIPDDYGSLMLTLGEFSVMWEEFSYLRIWQPHGCRDMDEAYRISVQLPGCFPMGDDGGCGFIAWCHIGNRQGIYHMRLENIDPHEAIYVSPTLKALLQFGEGLEVLTLRP